MTDINVISRTQHITVDPASSSVSIINAGPAGPAGSGGVSVYGIPAGGTTGQVLMKRSNADYDVMWATAAGPDFTLAVVPTSRNGVQSASTPAYAITATPVNGFAGTITWSATGLPSGATPTFSPTTGLTSNLTIALSSGCVPGTYNFNIVGTSGSLVRSISGTLVVTAAGVPDFSLAVSPSSRSAAQSTTSGAFAVTATALSGFAGTITWSVTGLPSGATPTFAPATGLSSSLTVALSAGCVVGSYPISIVGTSGALNHSIPVTLVVTSAAFVWPPVGSVAINPGDDWAAKVAANPAGTVFAIYPGTHHQVSITPKANMQFIGPRTLISGGTPKSIYGVIYNVGLIEAPTAILNGDNTVVNAFWGGNINGVTIKNLEITNYKFAQQSAAIDCCGNGGRTASGWYIENVYLHHNNYGGINIGDNCVANHCRTSYNAYVGYAASYADNATYEYCEIDHNWTAADNPWVEASGGKAAETTYFTMQYCWAHDHRSQGMWTDINNWHTTYKACLVERNGYAGIMHEISYNFMIYDCEFNGNTGTDGWNNSILVAASGSVQGEADSEIYHNLFVGNWADVMMVEQNRGTGSRGAYQCKNVYVHNNDSRNTTEGCGGWQDHADTSMFNTRNNRWDYNAYTNYPTWGFCWDAGWNNWAAWQATGNDVHGSKV